MTNKNYLNNHTAESDKITLGGVVIENSHTTNLYCMFTISEIYDIIKKQRCDERRMSKWNFCMHL
jgi:hypothetical protein